MTMEIDGIPHLALKELNARKAILRAAGDQGGRVLISTSLHPDGLHPMRNLRSLEECRRREGVHSITLTVLRMDAQLIQEATTFLENRYRIMSELDTLLRHVGEVYVVYAITHFNPEGRPYGPLMVNIGGDCYRTDPQIKDLEAILNRTRDLAEAMVKKAVMVFPDIPALHGGKKGEWIILDRKGRKIDGLSEEAIIALGSAIIPKGIGFLNELKERQGREVGLFERFPERDYVRPDSGSPDVLSGVYWRGERKDKFINMCDAWAQRGLDLSHFTCLPANLGGTLDSSARPTGYGVAVTAVELAKRYFEPRGKEIGEVRFLLEAAGGVGRNTVEALVHRYQVPPENITVFDRQEAACRQVGEKFRVATVTLSHADFYEARLPQDVERGVRYDVWINNGEGDNTRPAYVESLLAAGVRVFTGGANNFLRVATEAESRARVFDAGGWAWPDPATNGGGWTLAVTDVLARCQGRKANTEAVRDQILDTITSRNRQLVADVLDSLPPEATGAEVWNRVDQLIVHRVRKTLAAQLEPAELLAGADTTNWRLV